LLKKKQVKTANKVVTPAYSCVSTVNTLSSLQMSVFQSLTYKDIQAAVDGLSGKNWLPVVEAINDNNLNGRMLAPCFMASPEAIATFFKEKFHCQMEPFIADALRERIFNSAIAKGSAGEGSTTKKEPAPERHKATATVIGVKSKEGGITVQADGAENAEVTVKDAEAKKDVRALAHQGEDAITKGKLEESKTTLKNQLDKEWDNAEVKMTDLDNKLKPNECMATSVMVFASLTTAFAGIFAIVSQSLPEPVDGNETTYNGINDQTLDEQIAFAGNIIAFVFGFITTVLKQLEQKDNDQKEKDQKEKDDLIDIMSRLKICKYNLENATDEELKIRIGDGQKVLAEWLKA
jgi:hypothetical protein